MTDGGPSRVAGASFPFLLAMLAVAAVAPAYVNHDAAWYLHVVQRWFDGAALYRDVIDTNPPLIIWLSAPPVALARMTGWPAPAIFKIYVFAIAALSLFAVRGIVRHAWPDREFLLVSAVTFLCLPFAKGDFGQREHLAVLLTLPYIVGTAAWLDAVERRGMEQTSAHLNGRGLRVAVGIGAGLGFALKPHFLAALVAVEAVGVAARGWRALRRPELAAAASSIAAYALAAAVLTPAYFGVADQVRRVYGGLDSPPAVLLRLREAQLWLAAAALFAAVRWPRAERLPAVLFAAATAYLVAALLQFKGWGYQLYPARVFTVLFLIAAGAVVLHATPSLMSFLRGGRRGLALVFAAVLAAASVRYVAEARRPAAPDLATPLIEAIRTHGDSVAVLSMRTIIYPAFPAVTYARARWGLRHNSLWFLPGFYADQDRSGGGPLQAHAPDEMPALERTFFDQIVHDLCAAPPRLLAIEAPIAAAPAGRRALDLRAYYGQSPRAAHLFAGYHAVGEVGPFTLYTAADARCE